MTRSLPGYDCVRMETTESGSTGVGVGLGVWVDNVTPELRDRADYIVASNMDDGVAEVVERFLLN